jgi:hypothetical protein
MADSLNEAPDIPVAVVNHTFIDPDGNATVVEMESELFRLADNGWWLPELSGYGKVCPWHEVLISFWQTDRLLATHRRR